jgi:hypothetical protein
MFDLDLDPWGYRAERIPIGDNIHTAVLPLRSDKGRVVTHAAKQGSNQILEFVRILEGNLLFQALNGLLLYFMNGGFLALFPRLRDFLLITGFWGTVLTLPLSVGCGGGIQQSNLAKGKGGLSVGR